MGSRERAASADGIDDRCLPGAAVILLAFDQARKQGLLTIGLTGYDGGKMARSAALDFCIVAPGDHIPRIQEAQATTYHALLEIVHTLLRGQGIRGEEQVE